jgi:F0F1-type ATP synthase delta subunit
MSEAAPQPQPAKTFADYVLPPSVVSKADLTRLVNELELVDNQLTAANVRAKAGVAAQPAPTISQQLTDFLTQNQLDVREGQKRAEVIKQMRLLKDKAPIVNMTFAVVADRESLEQLANWLRTSVHRQAVIRVGLQPALVAGVYLRTPNHVRDLSLRAALSSSHDLLV